MKIKKTKQKNFTLYLKKKKKKNAGTARASNGLDMLTWCSFHILQEYDLQLY